MAGMVRLGGAGAPRRRGQTKVIGVAVLVLVGTAACSADHPKTQVRGEVLTKDDPYLGGPDPALAQFRAGERSVYGKPIPSIP
jgi:hypothetical protein